MKLSPHLTKLLGINWADGLRIVGVESGRPADRDGLRRGDIILKLDRSPIEWAGDFHRFLEEHPAGCSLSPFRS